MLHLRRKAARARVERGAAEFLLDAQELVVLRGAVGPRDGAGLDLADAVADREVRDGRVLGLAAAVRDDRAQPASCAMRIAAIVSVSVPIWFTLMRIALRGALLDAARSGARCW